MASTADGNLEDSACVPGALSGTHQVSAVIVNKSTDATIQIDVDTSTTSNLGVSFTPNIVNSTASLYNNT
ncbi:hypothetical protein [Alteromonas macleodii]|uniref:hypothetical protein n=1 Tax=Alteromonas macleodii TaxID=28108 RepID=UPI00313FF86F